MKKTHYILLVLFLISIKGFAQIPFNCSREAAFVLQEGIFSKYSPQTMQANVIASNVNFANGIGFNPIDDLIYGIEVGTRNLMIIDAAGTTYNLGSVTGLPNGNFNYSSGTVSLDGKLYVKTNNIAHRSEIFEIDLNIQPYQVTRVINLSTTYQSSDMVQSMVSGDFYTITDDTAPLKALKIDMSTGNVTTLANNVSPTQGYGAMWIDENDTIFALGRGDKRIYSFDISTNTWALHNRNPNLSNNGRLDAANCIRTVIAVCKNDTVYADQNGVATITVADIDNFSGPLYLIDSMWLSRESFTVCGTDSFDVHLYVKGRSKTDSCMASVLVIDTFDRGSISSISLSDTILCSGDFISLSYDSSSGVTAFWDFGQGIQDSSSIISLSFDNDGTTDSVVIANLIVNVCTIPDTLSQAITIFPDFDITGTTEVNAYCASGSNGSIDVSINGVTAPYTYQWSSGDTAQNITNLVGGSYSVTITDSNGCSSTSSFIVNDSIYPQLSIIAAITPTLICNTDEDLGAIDISVQTGSEPYNFDWSTGEISNIISGLSENSYSLIITDANGCELDTSFDISAISGIYPEIAIADPLCHGELGSIGLNNSVDSFYLNGILHDSQMEHIVGAGIYELEIVTSEGCDTLIEVELVEPDSISLLLTTEQDTLFGGESTLIVAVTAGDGDFSWTPWDIVDCQTCAEVIATPLQSQYVHATYGNDNCEVSDSIYLTVVPQGVFIPDAFSPNNDGANDEFKIYALGEVNVLFFKVLDRWGEVIFNGDNTNKEWDGTYKGMPVEPGVYVYHIGVSNISEYNGRIVESYKGSITVIK